MRRALSLVLAVALLALPLLVAGPVSHAQELPENLTNVRPEAPQPIENLATKALGLGMYIMLVLGLIGVLVGGAKFAMGAPDAGKWIIRGVVAFVFGIGFWAIIKWLL